MTQEQALNLVNEMNELIGDFEPWMDEDLTAQELENASMHGFDPELIQWARKRVDEIQTQLDL